MMRFSFPLLLILLSLSFPSFGAYSDKEVTGYDKSDKGVTAAKNGDYATALKEWTPLAEQGNAYAQFNLGSMYEYGDGVPQDYSTAVKWYTLSAEQGNANAQINLGMMYENGKGVPQDYKTAVKWHTLAAEQGDALAQFNLGLMYAFGRGVLQDNVYAHMWFNIAASNGVEHAPTGREMVAKQMTPADISKAQQCVAKDYKGC